MGESDEDRIGLLHQLATLDPHPESVPINMLVRVGGTPLGENEPADPLTLVRTIATARLLMPAAMVRLSAGRRSLTREAAALCFLAGANSIFVGEKLLTTPNPERDEDERLFRDLGLRAIRPMASHPASDFLVRLEGELACLAAQSQLRRLAVMPAANFCSNDYLGLSTDIAFEQGRCGRAGERRCAWVPPARGCFPATRRFGKSSRPNSPQFTGAEAALYFNSGYAANVGLFSCIAGPQDTIFSDQANHASIIDGIRLSGARKVIFPHLDLDFLECELRRCDGSGQKFIAVESVFSMDGDRAPLAELVALAQRYGAELIVDEAHATGVFGVGGRGPGGRDSGGRGPGGRGLMACSGAKQTALATVHPCGKAFAGMGAFVCCSETLKQYLINRARTFIFSTALPPYVAAQMRAAVRHRRCRRWCAQPPGQPGRVPARAVARGGI